MLRYIALVPFLMLATWVAPAFGEADGPDFYAVTGVAADDALNLRAGPSPYAERIGQIPHDAHGLQNLGCRGLPSFAEWEQMTQPQREESRKDYWCKVKYGGIEGWVAGRFLREDSAPAEGAVPVADLVAPTLDELRNIAYAGIYDEPVQLVNGVYEGEPFVPGGAARPRVELISDLYVTADIDSDGTQEAFVLLNENSGGTGQLLYLAAVAHAEGKARNVGTVRIGDRVDVMTLRAANGTATLEYVAPGPGEPACCPTLMVSSVYGLKDGELAELSREGLGTLSLEQLAGAPWRLTGLGWDDPIPDGVSITAEFEPDRISGSTGCNRYFASVTAPTPYQLHIGPVGATRMSCPPPQMEAEDRFLEALENATQYSFVLSKLVISYKQDDAYSLLVFERAAAQ